jgi:hypothetical protein
MSITIKKTAQANRLTFALLTVFTIGFGLFAEHHAQPELADTLHATTHATTNTATATTAKTTTTKHVTTNAITSLYGH